MFDIQIVHRIGPPGEHFARGSDSLRSGEVSIKALPSESTWDMPTSLDVYYACRTSATCIVAREIDAPKGVKPVEWRLLTNRTAPTLDDAIELIDWYRARWEIEIYFNSLKNVCKVTTPH